MATIFLVDDELQYMTAAVERLESLGHTVVCFDNPASAYQALDGVQPADLLISDIMMNGKERGIDFAIQMARRKHRIINRMFLWSSGDDSIANAQAAFTKYELKVPVYSKSLRGKELSDVVTKMLAG